jgi:PHS family inorganic phosphate transporter-like MFS transporter
MNNPSYIGDIWSGTDTPEPQIYKFLLGNAWQGLIIVSIGAVTGGLITVISVKKLGEETVQVTGFLLLFLLFIIIGSSFNTLMNDGRNSAIVVLYLLCQIFFNFGNYILVHSTKLWCQLASPSSYSLIKNLLTIDSAGPNSTTYMVRAFIEYDPKLSRSKEELTAFQIPAEFFPTRFRASSHGIAAACGKFGSVVAQIAVYFLSNHFGKTPTPGVNYIQVWLGDLLMWYDLFLYFFLFAFLCYSSLPVLLPHLCLYS